MGRRPLDSIFSPTIVVLIKFDARNALKCLLTLGIIFKLSALTTSVVTSVRFFLAWNQLGDSNGTRFV